ncbi:chorismate pyruvate-lyase family protein [Shimazuella kribbensis]|uniref:chorismate pyruvate-lyase family protein n=1 Tax=Shimazuella kribbensis TaxID=139808 RepID=UPI0003FC2775|nr:chorismate pyruvate-lyase family protein [Shimazuella kribbensis]
MEINQLHLNKIGNLIVQTTASITKLIEILYNVQLKVELINQQEMIHCPKLLKKHHKEKFEKPILREICLVDTHFSPFIYAETLFYKDNASFDIIHDLYHTNTPIGKIIEKHKLEFYREILDFGVVQDSNIASHLGLNDDDSMIYKVCNTIHQGKNLFLICEYFPIDRLNLSK